MNNTITEVPGITVGHYTDLKAATGCTVVLCEKGAVGGVDVRGSAPGTRETDLLRPMSLVSKVHAVLLGGGSAFGLAAADGVMRYLEEKGLGFKTSAGCVPVVPAAILFDLSVGDAKVRPGPEEGYQASLSATGQPVAEGSVGAGTGAVVGKILGASSATKGGLGSSSQRLGKDIVVGAVVAVSAFGDVIDPGTGVILAGPRRPEGGFFDTVELLRRADKPGHYFPMNTTIGVVATNASLTREQANKVAQVAHDGLARTIRPVHTMVDGDTLFVLATGECKSPVDDIALGAIAVEVVAEAVVRAVARAESLAGVPAARDVQRSRSAR
ncbi:MAG: P1 family peptidase [Dehalococcoidia bacterium]|nr:P1 family peptidase [Dehalococcoidia bacterium]